MATKKVNKSSKSQVTKVQMKKTNNRLVMAVVMLAVVAGGFVVYQTFAGLNIIDRATGGPWTLTSQIKTFNTLRFTPAKVGVGGKVSRYKICANAGTGGANATFIARSPFNSGRVTVYKNRQTVCTPATSLTGGAITPQLQKYAGPNIKMTDVYLVKE